MCTFQVLQYFEQLKNSADGWKMCAQAFSTGAYQGSVNCIVTTIHTEHQSYSEVSPTAHKIIFMNQNEEEEEGGNKGESRNIR